MWRRAAGTRPPTCRLIARQSLIEATRERDKLRDAHAAAAAAAEAAQKELAALLEQQKSGAEAQLEALLAGGTDTPERRQMVRQLQELLALEDQFKQVRTGRATRRIAPARRCGTRQARGGV